MRYPMFSGGEKNLCLLLRRSFDPISGLSLICLSVSPIRVTPGIREGSSASSKFSFLTGMTVFDTTATGAEEIEVSHVKAGFVFAERVCRTGCVRG